MQAFVAAAIGEIAEVVVFARWLGYLAVAVVALVLANSVFISAESRANEMAVLETVGMRKRLLMALVAAEGIGLGLAGGVLGTGLVAGWLWLQPLTLGVEGYGIDLLPSPKLLLQSLGVAFGIGVVAALPPAIAVGLRPLLHGVKAE
jgi:putative ABC transport system permease protein